MDNSFLVLGLSLVLDPVVLTFCVMGSLFGIIIGALPGLSVTMGLAIATPLTFSMDPITAYALLIGIFCGGTFGGSISAILLNIPGAFPALMTTLDGFPMAQRGEGGRAIGYAAFASLIGGIFSTIVLIFFAPVVAGFALQFGPQEYLSLTIMGLSIIAYLGSDSMIKGFIGGMLGLILTLVGTDPLWGTMRFTFGQLQLMGGLEVVVVLMGLFGMAQVLSNLEEPVAKIKTIAIKDKVVVKLKEFAKMWITVLRSCIIGTFIGALPGAGADIAAVVAYGFEKRFNKHPERLGTGIPEGIVAPETSNNACVGGAMIPTLSLGIPGSSAAAVLMGALILHGLSPGPLLFRDNPGITSAILLLTFLANISFAFFGLACARGFAKLLYVPAQYLYAIISFFCIVGSYCLRNNLFDVGVMLAFGIIGYFLRKLKIPTSPLILGLILGKMVESNLQRTLVVSRGNLLTIFTRPLSATFLSVTFLLMVLPLIMNFLKRRRR
jgi:putative tricarboxylic transport membrane protein